MNKKGFTLIELLAVVAILGIISIIAVPNIIKIYNDSLIKTMKNQEAEVSDAAQLFVKDYCSSKINSDYICPTHFKVNKYLCLSEVQDADYIKTVLYKNNTCMGIIDFEDDKSPKTYLICDGYETGELPSRIQTNECIGESPSGGTTPSESTDHILSIRYNGNGGTWAGNSSGNLSTDANDNVTVDGSIFEQLFTYGNYVGPTEGLIDYNKPTYINFTRTGYMVPTHQEWYAIDSSNRKTYFSQESTNIKSEEIALAAGCNLEAQNCVVTLYVNWVESSASNNILNIQYNANGGTWDSNSSSPYKLNTSTGYIIKKSDNTVFKQQVNYGDTINLLDYNDENNVKLLKSTYHVPSELEWYVVDTNNSEHITSFNQNDATISSNVIAEAAGCHLETQDCTVTLYVNWEKNHLFLLYNGNGGSWNTNGPSGFMNNGYKTYIIGEDGYVRYKEANDYHEANAIAYELSNYGESAKTTTYNGSWYNFVRSGYTVDANKEYFIRNENTGELTAIKHGTTTTYTAQQLSGYAGCDLAANDCTVALYVNWTPHTLNIQYNGNGGTWASTNSSLDVDNEGYVYYTSSLSRNIQVVTNNAANNAVINSNGGLSDYSNPGFIKFTRDGYTVTSGQEWYVMNETTKTTFSQTNNSLTASAVATAAGCNLTTQDCTVTLYINWIKEGTTLSCLLKGSGHTTNLSSITWDTNGHQGANYWIIDRTDGTPTFGTNVDSLTINSEGLYYGHVNNNTLGTKQCSINISRHCRGAGSSTYYQGHCTCCDDTYTNCEDLNIANTTSSSCSAYCKTKFPYIYASSGRLEVKTSYDCSGRVTTHICPSGGCWGKDGVCHIYEGTGACPSAYPNKWYFIGS